jgi:hypothetical protein
VHLRLVRLESSHVREEGGYGDLPSLAARQYVTRRAARTQALDRHLWMRCVYTAIELHRGRVRKAQASLRGAGEDVGGRRSECGEALRRAVGGFAKALEDSKGACRIQKTECTR